MENKEEVKAVLDNTVEEINEKIEKLNDYNAENGYNNKEILDDVINKFKETIESIKVNCSNVMSNDNIETTKKILEDAIKNINEKIKDLPDYNEIMEIILQKSKKLEKNVVESKQYQYINAKLEEVNAVDKTKKVVDIINNTTDSILYAARDLFDEIAANEDVKQILGSIKESLSESKKKIADSLNKNKEKE